MDALDWWKIAGALLAGVGVVAAIVHAFAKKMVSSYFERQESRFKQVHDHEGQLANHKMRIEYLEKNYMELAVNLGKQLERIETKVDKIDEKEDKLSQRMATFEGRHNLAEELRGMIRADRRVGDTS